MTCGDSPKAAKAGVEEGRPMVCEGEAEVW